MYLYELKGPARIRVLEDVVTPIGALPIYKGMVLNFYHLDGMYSVCATYDGTIYHASAHTKVEVLRGEPSSQKRLKFKLKGKYNDAKSKSY
jgi:hypothetical protein